MACDDGEHHEGGATAGQVCEIACLPPVLTLTLVCCSLVHGVLHGLWVMRSG